MGGFGGDRNHTELGIGVGTEPDVLIHTLKGFVTTPVGGGMVFGGRRGHWLEKMQRINILPFQPIRF